MLDRLRRGGAEQRLWPTQSGLRRQCGTRDATFLARRITEEPWERQGGKAILLALDRAKAFDSVSPAALNDALRRYGVPTPFIDMISFIYTDRRLFLQDAGATSAWYKQEYGICQGCPLSTFLYMIIMTVLFQNAKTSRITDGVHASLTPFCVDELVYADDTLLVGIDASILESFIMT